MIASMKSITFQSACGLSSKAQGSRVEPAESGEITEGSDEGKDLMVVGTPI
jgi:hypothetical protein